jgi:site-specific DNA-cytosine methylase
VTLYTDIDPFCCAVLASRVADGSLPDGDVVMADIHDLGAANLAGYTHIHLFCGIGGMPLGFAWAGWPADRSVLTGGFPCQNISAAGKGAGLDGAKSGLFWELLRILKELNADGEGPESVLLENVGALSRRGLDVVAAALGEAGYVVPESYRVGAWAVGAPHERERWWIVGWRVSRSKPDGGRGWSRDEEAGREGRSGTSASRASEGGREIGDATCPRGGRVSTRSRRPGKASPDVDGSGARERDAAQPDSKSEPKRKQEYGSRAESREDTREESGGLHSRGRAWSRGYQPRPGDWRKLGDEWFWAGPPILVHARGAGLGQQLAPSVASDPRHAAGRPDPVLGDAGGCGWRIDEPWRGSQGRTAPGRPDPTTERGWPVPVLPGYVQHEWELPRLYQRGVGDAVHGLPGRVASARNRAGIMALGNAVVPQVVKAVAAGMREAMA